MSEWSDTPTPSLESVSRLKVDGDCLRRVALKIRAIECHTADGEEHVVEWARLGGGLSSLMYVITLDAHDPEPTRYVLRVPSIEYDQTTIARVVEREYEVLCALSASTVVPVCRPVFRDHSNELIPASYLVLTYKDGRCGTNGHTDDWCCDVYARVLAEVHSVAPSVVAPLDAVLDTTRTVVEMALSSTEHACVAALRENQGIMRHDAVALVHGDIWPGNVLVHEGNVAAVLDWEDVMIGDVIMDVANTRCELLWALGERGMRMFTTAYEQRVGRIDEKRLAVWDLCIALLRPKAKTDAWADSKEEAESMHKRRNMMMHRAMKTLANDSTETIPLGEHGETIVLGE